jgi:hypothetical protein
MCALLSQLATLTFQHVVGLQDGWTPLHMAVKEGHLEVTRMLLGAGASVAATKRVRLPHYTMSL